MRRRTAQEAYRDWLGRLAQHPDDDIADIAGSAIDLFDRYRSSTLLAGWFPIPGSDPDAIFDAHEIHEDPWADFLEDGQTPAEYVQAELEARRLTIHGHHAAVWDDSDVPFDQDDVERYDHRATLDGCWDRIPYTVPALCWGHIVVDDHLYHLLPAWTWDDDDPLILAHDNRGRSEVLTVWARELGDDSFPGSTPAARAQAMVHWLEDQASIDVGGVSCEAELDLRARYSIATDAAARKEARHHE